MRDVTANSHETSLDADPEDIEFVVVWLGDDKERGLTDFYGVTEIGWYAIASMALLPYGPYDTSEAAYNGFKSYLAEK